jgi:hypothetical protein
MKKTFIRTFLAVLLCISLLPITSALALKASGSGTVRRGNFEDSGVSFQVPVSFTLESIDSGKEADTIKLVGPKDINEFIPKINVKIEAKPYDLANIKTDETISYIELDLKGSNALNLVDEKVAGSNGDMLRRVFFYNTEDGRMGILYRYMMNVSGYGVTFEYQAYTATRSLPDDLKVMPDLIKSLTIK